MTSFAVVRIGPTQYKVGMGDTIDVARMPGNIGDTVTISDVLLLAEDKTTKIGRPIVNGVRVEAKIEAQYKGGKIDVRRFKSKVRERRHIGFRPERTKLLITAIHA